MKKDEVKKLSAKSIPELAQEATLTKEKLWQARRDIMSGKIKNNHVVGELRRDIARMLTIVQNKNLAEKVTSKQVASNK